MLKFRFIHIPKVIMSAFLMTSLLVSCTNLNKLATGQTDRLGKEPFYKSYSKLSLTDAANIYQLPLDISDQVKLDLAYGSPKSNLKLLLEAIQTYIDSLSWTRLLKDSVLSREGLPWLYVGSSEGEYAPDGAEQIKAETDKYPPMIIHVEKASKEWKTRLVQKMAEVKGDFVMILRLSFNDFPKADKGLFKKKVVLGTDYEEGINFFSAEDKPVEVLQVTGMLLDKEGNILKAGSEGILAKDTPFSLQIFDIEKGIDNSAIRRLLEEERREDLPGKPLKWKVATYNLMASLLQK